jgi:hypothetical protein
LTEKQLYTFLWELFLLVILLARDQERL